MTAEICHHADGPFPEQPSHPGFDLEVEPWILPRCTCSKSGFFPCCCGEKSIVGEQSCKVETWEADRAGFKPGSFT